MSRAVVSYLGDCRSDLEKYSAVKSSGYENFKSEISNIIDHIQHPKLSVSYKDELEEVARGWGVVVERVEVICC